MDDGKLSEKKACELGIVIPAYKKDYFGSCLESIASQTDLNFHLYIGDDNSPDNLETIVDQYRSRMNIKYQKFEVNFGRKDLVSHWERCIDLAEGEDWIWLFSDDDIMDSDCVASFYKAREAYSRDLFRFPLNIISHDGSYIESVNFPKDLSSKEFIRRNLCGSIQSFAVEYIFRKKVFLEEGRFQKFDLAWGSDFATWAKIGNKKGIYTIDHGAVSWRKSEVNISQQVDRGMMIRKIDATSSYLLWVRTYFRTSFWILENKRFINQVQDGHSVLTHIDVMSACIGHYKRIPSAVLLIWNSFYLIVYFLYRRFRRYASHKVEPIR